MSRIEYGPQLKAHITAAGGWCQPTEQIYNPYKLNEEPSMALSQRKSVLEAEIARLQQELHTLNTLPKEPHLGAVILFSKSFGGRIAYDYAALRTTKGWFLTGKDSAAKTWEQLLDFACEGESADRETVLRSVLLQRLADSKYLINS